MNVAMKSYKFRIYPNKEQEEVLDKTFDMCRFTYNQLLEELNNQKKINRNKIQHKIVELKKEYPELNNVYSKTLQYECYRLFSNLKGLAKSKIKRKVGRLRFKGRNWFKTIQYNQSGYKLIKTNKRYNFLHLSKIGDIKLRQHRELRGKIKQITIKRYVDEWYAILITDEKYNLQKGEKQIGIDLGVINFITDTENNKINNPLYLNKSLDNLKEKQRLLSRKKKGSNNRKKAKNSLIKVYEKITNQRRDFIHKITTKYVNKSSLIAIEKLDIKQMTSNKNNKYYNHRNIIDSSWGLFISMLKHKAESADVKVVEINPKNTSKICSVCGNKQDMPIYKRSYECNNCGLSIDRDYNSAINILNKALGQGFVENQSDLMKQEAISLNLKNLGNV